MLNGPLVFFSDGRQVNQRSRDIHALPAADGPSVFNATSHLAVWLAGGGENGKANQPVCEQHGVARLQFTGQSTVLDGKRGASGFVEVLHTAYERDFAAVMKHRGFWKGAEPQLWPGQIGHDAGGLATLVLNVSNAVIEFGFVLRFTVGIIQSANIHACFEQGFERCAVIT